MTIWSKFEDPVWRKQAEQKTHKGIGGTWAKEDKDTKKEKQHKLKVTDFLFKSNLTEELLLKHPSPDDVKFFQDLRKSSLWDYFDASDISKLSRIEYHIVRQYKSLTEQNLKFINDGISRAKRLQHRDLKRVQGGKDKQKLEKYKQQVKKAYSDTK
jgi:hypothetical protein